MELAAQRVYFAGSTANPDEPWMVQIARNLSDPEYGFLHRKKFVIVDRDAKLSEEFRIAMEQATRYVPDDKTNGVLSVDKTQSEPDSGLTHDEAKLFRRAEQSSTAARKGTAPGFKAEAQTRI